MLKSIISLVALGASLAFAGLPNPVLNSQNPDSVDPQSLKSAKSANGATLMETGNHNGVQYELWKNKEDEPQKRQVARDSASYDLSDTGCSLSCFEGTFNRPNQTDCETVWAAQRNSTDALKVKAGWYAYVWSGNCAVIFENTGAGNPTFTYEWTQLGVTGEAINTFCKHDEYQGGACSFAGYENALVSVQSYQENHGS